MYIFFFFIICVGYSDMINNVVDSFCCCCCFAVCLFESIESVNLVTRKISNSSNWISIMSFCVLSIHQLNLCVFVFFSFVCLFKFLLSACFSILCVLYIVLDIFETFKSRFDMICFYFP